MTSRKFIYYLTEQPNYPNEIWADSKEEVRRLILESVPDESAIKDIIEVTPGMPRKSAVDKVVESEPDDYKNGQDFFNNIIKAAEIKGAEFDAKNAKQKPTVTVETVSQPEPAPQENTTPLPFPAPSTNERKVVEITEEPPKFFEEAGMQFKLDHGKLYKKTWTNVTDVEKPDYRIVSKQTNKPVSSDKYKIEKLEWVEISSNV